MSSTLVGAWWFSLCLVALLNIAAWFVSARTLRSHSERYGVAEYRRRWWLMALAAGYVAGCAFRSLLPRIDLTRVCLEGSWLSSMIIGRSVATVAELCFMAQCALLLHRVAASSGNAAARGLSLPLLPLIVIAECASWYAILSTNYLGHFVENSIWTLCALLLLAGLIALWPAAVGKQRRFLMGAAAMAVAYIAFMACIDLPMYWTRWSAQQASGATHLSLLQGLRDASRPCLVDHSWSVWREEIPWMTLYFTTAVWVSLLLPHAPVWKAQPMHREMT